MKTPKFIRRLTNFLCMCQLRLFLRVQCVLANFWWPSEKVRLVISCYKMSILIYPCVKFMTTFICQIIFFTLQGIFIIPGNVCPVYHQRENSLFSLLCCVTFALVFLFYYAATKFNQILI